MWWFIIFIVAAFIIYVNIKDNRESNKRAIKKIIDKAKNPSNEDDED